MYPTLGNAPSKNSDARQCTQQGELKDKLGSVPTKNPDAQGKVLRLLQGQVRSKNQLANFGNVPTTPGDGDGVHTNR